jgi:putative transposase
LLNVGEVQDRNMVVSMVKKALLMAMARRKPEPALIHHFDRGSDYACTEYRQVLQQNVIVISMSRSDNFLDNAVAEQFFRTKVYA